MAEEYFDLVDDNDVVVGRDTRKVVHATGLKHRAVHILVFDSKGRVFLQKRSMLKDLSPGLWDSSCSGHVDSGEDYDPAAVRELGEELGLVVSEVPERWFRLLACEETGWEFVWVYKITSDGPFHLNPAEIEAGEWLEPAEVTRRIARHPENYCTSFRLVWQKASGQR